MKPLFFSIVIGLCLSCLMSCESPVISDPKKELMEMIKDPNASGYYYATGESEGQVSSTLTNPVLNTFIEPNAEFQSVVLSYTQILDKKANTSFAYKSELVKRDTAFAIVVTNLTENSVYWEKFLAGIPDRDTIAVPQTVTFNSLADCIEDFNCKHKGELQCIANRTCETQFAAITCCLKNGQCFSVHLIIPPNTWRCRFKDLVPYLEGIVLSRD